MILNQNIKSYANHCFLYKNFDTAQVVYIRVSGLILQFLKELGRIKGYESVKVIDPARNLKWYIN